jgi:2-C-methyl-D-erythritol 2,4-cyclodiphosphate synthase
VAESRFGLGFDVHPHGSIRPLLLGGVLLDPDHGLAGHSDGDVVCPALADALLGAVVMGDIGDLFPDSDPAFKGIAGLDLLTRVVARVGGAGWVPESADLTVLAEHPPIAPRRDEVRASLADALGVGADRVSLKATRPEGLGLTGDGVGCLALAVVRPA